MPGWHARLKDRLNDDVVMLGVIQEQHPERCELFAQWHQMRWPILHDPINLLGNAAVPMTILIDEHGIVRSTRPRPDSIDSTFLDKVFAKPDKLKIPFRGVDPQWRSVVKKAESSENSTMEKLAGDALLLWGGAEQDGRTEKQRETDKGGVGKLTQAIGFYRSAARRNPQDASLLFRLGVAFQMRNESPNRQAGDFAKAVEYWQKALSANPNQYIWRRRIQQYGPRLDKPYPFYDWVRVARKEIRSRGESPIALPVEPKGAELASRAKELESAPQAENPDPDAAVRRDSKGLIKIQSVVVPHTYKPETSAMMHIEFDPAKGVSWSNEAGPLTVWIEGQGIQQSRQRFELTNRNSLESDESRKIEFEIQTDGKAKALNGFALYFVCEKEGGECQYVRQDFKVKLK